jgi:hypothetical protein
VHCLWEKEGHVSGSARLCRVRRFAARGKARTARRSNTPGKRKGILRRLANAWKAAVRSEEYARVARLLKYFGSDRPSCCENGPVVFVPWASRRTGQCVERQRLRSDVADVGGSPTAVVLRRVIDEHLVRQPQLVENALDLAEHVLGEQPREQVVCPGVGEVLPHADAAATTR